MTIEWNKVTWYSKLAAVILFVGVFWLGFWLGTMKAEKIYIEVPHIVRHAQEAPNKITSTVVLDGIEKFVDWKTYSDKKYGFQFKYPSFESWEVDDADVSATFISFKNFAFGVIPKSKVMTLDQWFSKNVDEDDMLIKTGVFKKILYKGNPALVATRIEVPSKFIDDYGPIFVTFYTEFPSKDYILSFTMPPIDLPPGEKIQSHGYDFPDARQRFQEDILSTLTF
jgi:hypothetical protein